jgi:hypothetical protein
MVDNFALAIAHGLLMLVAWRLLFRPDLDSDDAPASPPEKNLRPRPRADADA